MDKSKKVTSKKNKTTGSSRSAAKGKDVTDCANAHDNIVIASSPVETRDQPKENVELNRLRQRNQQLEELTQRLNEEISALRQSIANPTELINSLTGAIQSLGDDGESQLEQVSTNCIRQCKELLEIKALSERQSTMLKNLREAITSGGCARCTFRRSYEDFDIPLTTAVQCTELSSTGQRQTRQVLLNDGRQFELTSAASSDSQDALSSPASPSARYPSHTSSVLETVDPGSRTADDGDVQPNDVSLHDEAKTVTAAAASDNAVPPCPVYQRSGFASHLELNRHVNNQHLDVEDVVD